MRVIHRIVGYDKATDELAAQLDLPAAKLALAKQIASVPPSDPDAAGSYPLSEAEAERLGREIGSVLDLRRYAWFLEPFADWNDPRDRPQLESVDARIAGRSVRVRDTR